MTEWHMTEWRWLKLACVEMAEACLRLKLEARVQVTTTIGKVDETWDLLNE